VEGQDNTHASSSRGASRSGTVGTPLRRRVLIAVSLASLLFLDVWSYIESPYLSYFLPPGLVPTHERLAMLLAALIDITVLAAALVVAAQLAQNSVRLKTARDFAFLLLLLVPINMLRRRYHLFAYQSLVDHYGRLGTVGLMFLALILACVVAWYRRPFVRGATLLVLLLSPLPVLVLGQSLYQIYTSRPKHIADSVVGARDAANPSNGGGSRIVWLIFDELDQYLLFDGRPAGMELRGFDAFREMSLSAERAIRPGKDTIDAVPAALTCQRMTGADVTPSGSLLLTPCSGAPHTFQSTQTVFAAARSLGLTTAMVGWYHPYCRVLGDALTYCYARPAESQFVEEIATRNRRLSGMAIDLARRQLLQFPLAERSGLVRVQTPSPEMVRESQTEHLDEFTDLYNHALAVIRDSHYRFTVVHLPVPHLPGLYDRRTGSLTAGNGNYFDNLVLADNVLSEVRVTLEQAGLWDRTAVLVTSDHPLRVSILQSLRDGSADAERRATGDRERPYIPFLLRLPKETGRAEFTEEFDSTVAGDIALAAAEGKLASYSEAIAALKRHGRPEACNTSNALNGSDANMSMP